jgi:hypothetical protein
MSYSESKAEPDAYCDAGAYGNEVDEDFEDRDYEDGAETHGFLIVEVTFR